MEFNINRKTLFDDAAIQYDRFRPKYPDNMIEDVVSLGSLSEESRLLEVGCGTGKATISFARRNCFIDCVEPGKNLAEVAARNCAAWAKVSFFVTEFESFEFRQHYYDLFFSAQAFHWIDPKRRMKLAASALKPNGSFALLYNYSPRPEDSLSKEVSQLFIEQTDNRIDGTWDYSADINRWKTEITDSGFFYDLTITHYPWQKTFTATEYAGLFTTFSDFRTLEPSLQYKLLKSVVNLIKAKGNLITKTYEGLLFHAKLKNE